MKKFLSIVLSLTMIATIVFSNVISVSAENLNPQFSADITEGTGDYEGYLIINGYLTTDKNMDYSKVQNAPPRYAGSYVKTMTAAIKINAPFFDIDNAADYTFFNEEYIPCSDTVQKFSVLDNGTRSKFVISDGKTYADDNTIKLFELLVWPAEGWTKEQIMAAEDWYTLTELVVSIDTYNSEKSTSTDFTTEFYNLNQGQAQYDIVTDTTNTPTLTVAEGVDAGDTITWTVFSPVSSLSAGLTAKIDADAENSMTKDLVVVDSPVYNVEGAGYAQFDLILSGITNQALNAGTVLSILKTGTETVLGSNGVAAN